MDADLKFDYFLKCYVLKFSLFWGKIIC